MRNGLRNECLTNILTRKKSEGLYTTLERNTEAADGIHLGKDKTAHGRPLQRLDISWALHSNIFYFIVQLKFSALIISFHNIYFNIILLLYMTEGFCIGELMSQNLWLQRLEMPSRPKVHSFHGLLSYFPEFIANREQILIQLLLIIVLYDTN